MILVILVFVFCGCVFIIINLASRIKNKPASSSMNQQRSDLEATAQFFKVGFKTFYLRTKALFI